MQYGDKMKHQINHGDLSAIKSRLDAVMKQDEDDISEIYKIRSLQFANVYIKQGRKPRSLF